MKLSLLITAMAATAIAGPNRDKCNKKNDRVGRAIDIFCGNKNIVVPSNYAQNWAHVGTGGPKDTKIRITGNCKPPQWVPQKYCKLQFDAMCANSGKGTKGASTKRFGRGGCQYWEIDVGRRGGKGQGIGMIFGRDAEDDADVGDVDGDED